MKRTATGMLTLCLLCLAWPAAVTHAAPSLRAQLTAAKKSRAAWVKRAQRAEATVRRLQADSADVATLLEDADAQLASRDQQIVTLTGQIGTLTSQNAALRGGVPDQVAAIARTGVAADLQAFVLNPVHGAWPCRGSVFLGQTFFSYDFNLPSASGSC